MVAVKQVYIVPQLDVVGFPKIRTLQAVFGKTLLHLTRNDAIHRTAIR